HAEAGGVGDFQLAVHRHRLIGEDAAKNRADRAAVGAGGNVFADRGIRLAGDVVVGIGAAAVRNDGNIIGRSVGADTQQFGEPTDPHHIGLQDVDGAFLDQPAETEAGIFVLASG